MTVTWPGGDPRDVARAIVADPRYHLSTVPNAGPSPLQRLLDWIVARIGDFFNAIGRVTGASSPLTVALGFLVLGAFVVLAGYLVVRFVRLPRPGARRSPETVPLAAAGTSGDLVARALAAARAERWHDAASLLAQAALHVLDETGRLAFDPARTSGEARRLIRDPAYDAFERASIVAVFASGAATGERFAQLQHLYHAFAERA